jgi:hypothetical protein
MLQLTGFAENIFDSDRSSDTRRHWQQVTFAVVYRTQSVTVPGAGSRVLAFPLFWMAVSKDFIQRQKSN